MEEPSPVKTEDSDDSDNNLESEKHSRNSVPSKLLPYKGGTRAAEWLEVILKHETTQTHFSGGASVLNAGRARSRPHEAWVHSS